MTRPRHYAGAAAPRRMPESERRRIHGPLQPMPRDSAPLSWSMIGKLAAIAVAIVAFTWIVLPGLAWLTLELAR